MTTKNDSISGIDTANLLALSSELLSIANIINLPVEANYNYQDFINVLLHAATSPTDSLESACNDLKSKMPNIGIPSADTIFNYIKTNSIDNILSSFQKINDEIFRMMDIKNNFMTLLLISMTFHIMDAEILPVLGE